MKNFETRRDRFEFFDRFDNPLINVTFPIEVEDFRPYCKANGYPPFHFFLYCLFHALMKSENFRYRFYNNDVILVDELIPSYTVMNEDKVLNFTRFENSRDVKTFIQRSLAAREESTKSKSLMHTSLEISERERKNYVFITSLPWLEFTSIQHPVGNYKSVDIPSLAWGKFVDAPGNKIRMPFSVQAHHGFVDGYHIHQLAEELKQSIAELVKR